MKQPVEDIPNPATPIFELAEKLNDLAEREALLQSARKVDEVHRHAMSVLARGESLKMSMASRSNKAPTWLAVLLIGTVLSVFAYALIDLML